MKKISAVNYNSFCIIQTAFIGDTVLTLYLAQTLKSINPNCKITFVCTPVSSNIINSCNAVDNVVIYDKKGTHKGIGGIRHIAELLNECDCIITPHRSLRSALITFLSKAKLTIGFDINAFAFFLKRKVKYRSELHEIERNHLLLSVFEEKTEIQTPIINISKNDKDHIDKLFSKIRSDKSLIVLAPGSVWETKKWPLRYFAELCIMLQEHGFICILSGSQSEINMCDTISKASGAYNFAGKTSLLQSFELFKRSVCIVSNDSSPVHIAGIAQVPAAVIFGATSPVFGFATRNEYDRIIENNDLKCRPCAIHGGKECPLQTFDCMISIKPEIVYNNILSMLKKKDII